MCSALKKVENHCPINLKNAYKKKAKKGFAVAEEQAVHEQE